MAQINYTATADLKAFSSWCTTNIDQSLSTWDSQTGEGTLVLNGGVTEIGANAFDGCTTITKVNVGEGITRIGNSAFRNCSNLLKISVSNSLSSFGEYIVSNCSSLVSFIIDRISPPLANFNTFFNISNATLYVPSSGIALYKNYVGNYYRIGTGFTEVLPIPLKIVYTATADLKSFSTWLTNNVNQNESTWNSSTNEGVLVLNDMVSEIGEDTFRNCTSLLTIEIPNSISYIYNSAFKGCSNLTKAIILAYISEIKENTFEGCSNLTILTLPWTITTIKAYAFKDCSSLTSLRLPSSISNIENYAFNNCSSLVNVTCKAYNKPSIGTNNFSAQNSTLQVLPDLVTIYQNDTNWANSFSNITALTLTNTIEYIGINDIMLSPTSWMTNNVLSHTYDSVTKIGSLTLDSSVNSIEREGIYYKTDLISIELPLTITKLNYHSLASNYNLTSIIADGVRTYDSYLLQGYACCANNVSLFYVSFASATSTPQDSSTNSNAVGLFGFCSNLQIVNMPNLKNIGDKSFQYCESLSHISLNNSPTNIRGLAFRGCSSLTSIDLSNVISIGNGAFSGCNFETINIPATCTNIDDTSFSSHANLLSITVEQNNTTFNDGNNGNCLIRTSTNTLILGCKNTIIPDYVTSIRNYAFYNCSGLTSIDLSNITTLGDSVFSGCSGLTSIDLSNVTTFGGFVFSGCTSLASVILPSSLTNITQYAFSGCTSLASVILPSSLTNITQYAFNNCTNLLSVTSLATTPPTLGTGNFTSSEDTLYVPAASKSAYQSASNWSTAFTNYVGLCEVTSTVTGSGSVSPSSTTLNEGESVTLTITPDEGCGIFSVTDNGTSVPVTHTGMTYTISNIAADHAIAVVFKPYFEINIQVTEGGSLSFPDMAFAGEDFTITATPNEGFDVNEFVVDGTDLGRSVYSYTFQAVDSNHSVEVVFSPIYNITIESTEGGTIEGPSIALGGDDVTFTITPDEGMLIFNVLDNDVPVPVNPLGMTYIISNIQTNHTIEVIFAVEKSYGFDLSNLSDDDYIIQIYEEKKNL